MRRTVAAPRIRHRGQSYGRHAPAVAAAPIVAFLTHVSSLFPHLDIVHLDKRRVAEIPRVDGPVTKPYPHLTRASWSWVVHVRIYDRSLNTFNHDCRHACHLFVAQVAIPRHDECCTPVGRFSSTATALVNVHISGSPRLASSAKSDAIAVPVAPRAFHAKRHPVCCRIDLVGRRRDPAVIVRDAGVSTMMTMEPVPVSVEDAALGRARVARHGAKRARALDLTKGHLRRRVPSNVLHVILGDAVGSHDIGRHGKACRVRGHTHVPSHSAEPALGLSIKSVKREARAHVVAVGCLARILRVCECHQRCATHRCRYRAETPGPMKHSWIFITFHLYICSLVALWSAEHPRQSVKVCGLVRMILGNDAHLHAHTIAVVACECGQPQSGKH